MKADYIMSIYKADRRYKAGERLVSTTVWRSRDEAEMRWARQEFQNGVWPVSQGFRIDFHPTTKTVKNLMTGEDVVIPWDTPRSCDPSTELYWSV